MRCLSCNRRLNDKESTRKYSSSGEYIDLCDRCFSYVADEIPDVEEPITGEFPGVFDDNDVDDTGDEFFDGFGIIDEGESRE
jgi:hypothetical protein